MSYCFLIGHLICSIFVLGECFIQTLICITSCSSYLTFLRIFSCNFISISLPWLLQYPFKKIVPFFLDSEVLNILFKCLLVLIDISNIVIKFLYFRSTVYVSLVFLSSWTWEINSTQSLTQTHSLNGWISLYDAEHNSLTMRRRLHPISNISLI